MINKKTGWNKTDVSDEFKIKFGFFTYTLFVLWMWISKIISLRREISCFLSTWVDDKMGENEVVDLSHRNESLVELGPFDSWQKKKTQNILVPT